MTTSANTCPECHSTLPPTAPRGLCPACLLKRGLETNTVGYTEQPAPSWTPPTAEQLAPRFPELDILHLLGRGGMGAVYLANQKSLNRPVALKILPPHLSTDPAGRREGGFSERFANEAQAMAKLNHPHIVTIYEFGSRTSQPLSASVPLSLSASPIFFFLMEFVDGLSLRQLLNAGHISPKEALAIVPQICEALQYAHDHEIVHRDIKPENILLNQQGQVKIADFGLAKLIGLSASPEKPMGTPRYMAPEQQSDPDAVDHRADIYSLGVVFYQLLTGELPSSRLEPPSKRVHIDVRLDHVVLRALETEPEKRYQHAVDVKTEVETIISTPPAATRPHVAAPASAPPAPQAGSPPRFSRIVILGAAWMTLFFAVVPAFLVHEYQTQEFWRHGPLASPLGTLVSFFILLPAFTAPFGVTLCGVIAIANIRHSAGRLYGLGLAFFDALFFPTLLLNAFFFWASAGLFLLLAKAMTGSSGPWITHPYPVLWPSVAAATCLAADARILYWARGQIASATPSPPAPPPYRP